MKSRVLMATGVVFIAALALMTSNASAHHSFSAEFDAKKPVKLTGVITRMDWVNPHSWLYIDVKEPDGKVVNWKLEFGLPNALYRRGWKQKDLPKGVAVTVTGYRAKDGTATANASTVTLADGRRLFAGSSGQGAPPPEQ